MEWISGNVFIRPHDRRAGEVIHGHKHNFDHTSFFVSGRWLVESLDEHDGVLKAAEFGPALGMARWHCLIRAGVRHRITCLEDGIMACVYAHRDAQGRVTQQCEGWDEAYV